MNDISQKFNLYDHLAYIFVGLYLICSLFLLYSLNAAPQLTQVFLLFKPEFSLALILGAYLAGHITQAISNILEQWETKEKENNDFKYVMDKARTFFNLSQDIPENIVWKYCYLYALSKDFSGHVSLFNSMYGLYSGFWAASCITLIAALSLLINSLFHLKNVLPLDGALLCFISVMASLAILFFRRKKRFYHYLNEKTMITFDILREKP